ncbi:MAG: S8 family serine peptidase [Treponema sp.]|nr:S8 family serine peptidase [Treponema sp.]
MNKTKKAILLGLFVLFALSTVQCNLEAPQMQNGMSAARSVVPEFVEERRYSNATLADRFSNNIIGIILSRSAGFREFTPVDFKEIGVIEVIDVTYYCMKLVQSQLEAERTGGWSTLRQDGEIFWPMNTTTFRRMLYLILPEESTKEDVLNAIVKLRDRDDVLYVGPNYYIEFPEITRGSSEAFAEFNIATEELLRNQPNNQQAMFNRISLPAAWEYTTGSPTIRVGILEGGFQWFHQSLANQIYSRLNRDFSTGVLNGIPGGMTDDWHGTQVAGIIGANGTNARGVSPNVRLVSLQIAPPNHAGTNLSWNLVNAITWANRPGNNFIHILNLSMSTNSDDMIRQAIRNYRGLFVAGAGNFELSLPPPTTRPADFPAYWTNDPDIHNIISVGATTLGALPNEERRARPGDPGWNFRESAYCPITVDIFAPGTDIWTTFPRNSYDTVSGTSFAAPIVSGVAALILSVNPDLTTEQLRAAIVNNVDILPNLPQNYSTSGGRINALRAVTSVLTSVYIQNIPGVQAPMPGRVPVRTITGTQFTGTVTWNPPVHGAFFTGADYAATITLTRRPGFTFQRVPENFFRVPGAGRVTNAANCGVVTVIFREPINILDIPGVTLPLPGATPVRTITATPQYTGIVTWDPNHNPFRNNVQYTATIRLAPRAGFSLQGLPANSFRVAGATVTHEENSGLITAVFPPTTETTITHLRIPPVAIPVTGGHTAPWAINSIQYTAIVNWSPLPFNQIFSSGTVYTAQIQVIPNPGFTLQGVQANTFTVTGAVSVTHAANSGLVSAVFPATAINPINLSTIVVTPPRHDRTPTNQILETFQFAGGVTWSPNPINGRFAAGTQYTATINLQPRNGFSLEVPANFFSTWGVETIATHSANCGIITVVFPVTPSTPVYIPGIRGVSIPVPGEIPVSLIYETDQFTGTVSWSPNHAVFAPGTVYTATIQLTPKSGYTLEGVQDNFFRMAGATVTSSGGTVTAVFDRNVNLLGYINIHIETSDAYGLIGVFHMYDNGAWEIIPSATSIYPVWPYSFRFDPYMYLQFGPIPQGISDFLSSSRGLVIDIWYEIPTIEIIPFDGWPSWYIGVFSSFTLITSTGIFLPVGNLVDALGCFIFWDRWPARVHEPNWFNSGLLTYTGDGDPMIFFHDAAEAMSRGIPLSTFINESNNAELLQVR